MIFVMRFFRGSDDTKIFLVKSDPKRKTFFNRTDFISKWKMMHPNIYSRFT